MKHSQFLCCLFLAGLALLPIPSFANPAPKADPEEDAIEAKVVAVNRGFGFIVVDAGSKKGVEKGMVVDVLRGKKWVSGVLEIGEIEEDATVLEYAEGKSDPRDRLDRVRFRKPKTDGQ